MAKMILDFETFYATDYSLRGMHTSSYVRDVRFKVHGASIATGNKKPVWITGSALPTFFAAVDWSKIDLIGHNLQFDGLILTQRYGISPRSWIDTLGMSRAIIGSRIKSHSLDNVGRVLGVGGKLDGGKALAEVKGCRDLTPEQEAKLAAYAIDDANVTRGIYNRLAPAFPAQELEVLSWTIDMGVKPSFTIDTEPLLELEKSEKHRKKAAIKRIGLTQTQLRSGKQFAAILEQAGVTPPKKISPTTGRETFAFSKQDEAFTDLLEHPDERIVDLVEAKLLVASSIKETRAKNMTALAGQGLWCLQINYAGAKQTHRFSGGGGVNPQNLPRSVPGDPSLLRRALTCRPDQRIVAMDLSQIELRVNCAVCGQQDVLDRLIAKEDEYCYFASQIYGRKITKADQIERLVGKIAVLSLGYGAGAATFRTMLRGYGLRMTLEECQKIVRAYRKAYPYIANSWKVYDGWLNSFMHGETPQMHYPINAPIKLKSDGFILPSGLNVSYPKLGRFDWDYRKRVNMHNATYSDGIPNTDGINYAEDAVIGAVYQNEDKNVGVASIYGSKICGNICQSLARDVNTDYVRQLRAVLPSIDPTLSGGPVVAMPVHDESVVVCDADKAEAVLEEGLRIMNTRLEWWPELPVAAEGSIGINYEEAK